MIAESSRGTEARWTDGTADCPGGVRARAERPNQLDVPSSGQARLHRSYAWGLDASGTLTGAGGVGGLLLTSHHTLQADGSTQVTTLAPLYDFNGNVLAYADVATSTITHRMEYDPFGQELSLDTLLPGEGAAEAPRFRFSTNYTDGETGLVYYGYRSYSPELGRWVNRDPIEERGGINLYGMVGNDAVNYVDVLGLLVENSRNQALISQILCQEKNIQLQKPTVKQEPTNYKNSLARIFGAAGQWFSLLGVSSYANDTTATAYAIGTARLLALHEQGILTEQEVRKYIKEVDISRDARALKGKLDEMWSKLDKIMPDDKKPYRGRIQAQRKIPLLDKKENWARLFPVTQKEGQLYFNLLWGQLNGDEKDQFGYAISTARQWVNRGPHLKGHNFLAVRYHPSPSSVIDPKHSRVDIEIFIGETFVP